MPFTQRKVGNQVVNYTKKPGGKLGSRHGTFPNTPAGKRRADAQQRLLWSTLHNEKKALKVQAAVDYRAIASQIEALKRLLLAGSSSWQIQANRLADSIAQQARNAQPPNDLRLMSASKRIQRAATMWLTNLRNPEPLSALLNQARQTLQETGQIKMESSQNVGLGIEDDQAVNARFQKGQEVFVKSMGEVGVVSKVGVRGKSVVYRVEIKSGFAICSAGDLNFAGKAAVKALKSDAAALVKLVDADTLTQDDVGGAIMTLDQRSKAVTILARPVTVAALRSLKAAWAILRANPKAYDAAKTFIKQAADQLGEVEATQMFPDAPDETDPTKATSIQRRVKALVGHVNKIKAAGALAAEDEDALADDTEVLRAYTLKTGDPDQLAALANVEDAIRSARDPGMQAWSDRILSMVNQYQDQIAQIG